MEALKAGKHVMCTVPMATTVDECEQICRAREADRPEVHDGRDGGLLAASFCSSRRCTRRASSARFSIWPASHPQDMDGWPAYWEKMIPMHYATHVVSPCLGLINGRAEYVSLLRLGHGARRHRRRSRATSSPSSRATSRSRIRDVAAHIWRFLYDTARQYRESFDVYGTKKSFEWTLVEDEPHVIHTAKKPEPEIPTQVKVPDFAHLLPEPIRQFTQPSIQDAEHLSFIQGGGHGGSHPHLVNEFLNALVQNRDPWPNAVQSANWTGRGASTPEAASTAFAQRAEARGDDRLGERQPEQHADQGGERGQFDAAPQGGDVGAVHRRAQLYVVQCEPPGAPRAS